MGKISARLWELPCPVKAVRKQLKARRKLEKLQRSNTIEIAPEDLQRVHLQVNGSNNRITIGNDCIIAWGAVVSRSFPEANCAIAGNPAQVVKQGITWDANGARHEYIDNE